VEADLLEKTRSHSDDRKNELQEDFQRQVEHARKWYGAPFDEL
jgi:hypothetical protein